MTIKTLTFHGWKLELDSREIYPNDPGAGTPAIVASPADETATYFCAVDTGEVDGWREIPADVLAWLETQRDTVEDFLAEHGG